MTELLHRMPYWPVLLSAALVLVVGFWPGRRN